MKLQMIQPGIHVIQIEYVRSFVIEATDDDFVTLIDTGFDRTAEDFVSLLDSEFGCVNRVVLSHHGPDHYGDSIT